MATEWQLDDVGHAVTAVNKSATTAIRAGDIVYAATGTTSQMQSTSANSRSGFTYNLVQVKSCRFNNTAANRKRVIGVALTDADAGAELTVLQEGLFLSPIDATATKLTSGHPVKAAASTTSGVDPLAQDYGTTSTGLAVFYKCGKCLVGANSTKDYVVWKMTL